MLATTSTSGASSSGASRLDDRAARTRRATRRDGRDVLRERARRRRARPGASARPASGCSARTPASRSPRSTARPASSRRAGREGRHVERAARRARAVRDDRRARYVCELVALSPHGEELRGTGVARGPDRARAARHRGLRLRPGLRPATARSGRWPSSATRGRRGTRTAPARPGAARRATAGQAERLCAAAGSRRWAPPVDLGAEHDHVRHHVEPDEQDRRAAEAPAAVESRARRT